MNYYESKDLDRFGEIGQFRGELAEKFFDYYNSVTAHDGALTKREKALIALAVAHAKQCPYCKERRVAAVVERTGLRRTPLRLRLQPDARFESFRGIGRDYLRFRSRQAAQSQDHLRPTLLRLRGRSGQQLWRRDGERMILTCLLEWQYFYTQ